MKVAHITDPHLNNLTEEEVVKFGETVQATCTANGVQHVVITGDISEWPTLERDLRYLARGVGPKLSIHFCLGNHDFFFASFEEAKKEVSSWVGYLESQDFIRLDECTALCGVDGWYDFRSGKGSQTKTLMPEWHSTREFRYKTHQEVVAKSRSLAKESAKIALRQMTLAVQAGHQKVILATHVPPFRDAAWRIDGISNDTWLPLMTNLALGDTLLYFAAKHPQVDVTVLCGHTHTERHLHVYPNLNIRVGAAGYKEPKMTLRTI